MNIWAKIMFFVLLFVFLSNNPLDILWQVFFKAIVDLFYRMRENKMNIIYIIQYSLKIYIFI